MASRQSKAGNEPADDAAREGIEQHHQEGTEQEGPVFGIGGDLLVEPDEHQRTDWRAPEIIHAAEDGHDHDLGRFRPEHVVGKDAAAEDAVKRTGEAGERAGDDKGGELVGADIETDKGGALGIVADRRQHAAERRAHYPVQHR